MVGAALELLMNLLRKAVRNEEHRAGNKIWQAL